MAGGEGGKEVSRRIPGDARGGSAPSTSRGAFRRPGDELIGFALRRVMAKAGSVGSQTKLLEMVNAELAKGDALYRVGAQRLRRICATSGFCSMEVRARKDAGDDGSDECPVCGGALQRVKNRTLFGGTVTLEYRCARCPYWTGKERRVPTRYLFTLRDWKFGPRRSRDAAPAGSSDLASSDSPKRRRGKGLAPLATTTVARKR